MILDYNNAIIDYIKTHRIENDFIGFRLCEKDFTDCQDIILGINPSNAIKGLLQKEFQRQIQLDLPDFYSKVNNEQEAYNSFLSFPNFESNRSTICVLEKMAHHFHPHFKKHSQFAAFLNLGSSYLFMDLFPIWEKDQHILLQKLNNRPELLNFLVDSFLNLLATQSIRRLFFFNFGAYELFAKSIEHSKNATLTKIQVKKIKIQSRKSAFYMRRAELKLKDNKVIQVNVFGIGAHSISREALRELANAYQQTKF
jgi:hypothetical protein